MIKIDLINAERIFRLEAERQSSLIYNFHDDGEAMIRINQINNKVRHTEEVLRTGRMALDVLEVNDSVRNFALLALLNHDIGRFLQMRLTGTYKDYEANAKIGIADHGVLGKLALLGELANEYPLLGISQGSILAEQVPDGELFYKPIAKIVEDHVSRRNSDEELKILATDILQKYSMDEILKMDEKTVNSVLGTITQLVQDADRLDIYYQVISGIWSPPVEDEPIHPEIVSTFYRGEYIDIAHFKSKGIWNNNAGDLVRLSFINQIRLLSVAKVIQQENLITRLKLARNNPYANEAFDYTNNLLNELIANSEDGVTLGKVKKKNI